MQTITRRIAHLAVLAAIACAMGPAPAVGQTVSFVPTESVPTEPAFTVPLAIACGAESVKGVEVRVAFDPFLVRLDAITPGDWYSGAGVAFFFYDYTPDDGPGTIHLASSVLDGSLQGAGILAVCHFTILDFGITPLIFQDVDVRGEFNESLPFQHSSGDRIILDPVVGTAAASFGAIKALYR